MEEIKDFMKKLFPVVELHKYMWDHLASTLLGTCKEQTLNMYVGIGQNGKSVLVNLMEQVLGDYKGDVPLSLLTQQRSTLRHQLISLIEFTIGKFQHTLTLL